MTAVSIVIAGERYLAITVVADCYHVEVNWLEEAVEIGLLDEAIRSEGVLWLAARALDRVAAIRRVQMQTGLDLVAVAAWLD